MTPSMEAQNLLLTIEMVRLLPMPLEENIQKIHISGKSLWPDLGQSCLLVDDLDGFGRKVSVKR